MAPRKIDNMTEFAKAIGLSRPTVSIYFKDPDSVRPATRVIIERGLQTYDYNPHFLAANAGRKFIRAIGIVVPAITDPFYSELVNTIEVCAEKLGYLTVLQCSHHDAQIESRAVERLLSLKVSGIAMAPLGFSTKAATVEKAQRNTSLIFMDSWYRSEVAFIGNDNRQSIGGLVDYLCRTDAPPAFFTLPALNNSVTDRQTAYVERMTHHGYEPIILNPDPTLRTNNFEHFGSEEFMKLAPGLIEKTRSIICVNDRVAFGLMAAASKMGLRIGKSASDHLRVAGHDNQHFAAYSAPALTTAAQDIKRIGELTVAALTDNDGDNALMHGGFLVGGRLIVRDSA